MTNDARAADLQLLPCPFCGQTKSVVVAACQDYHEPDCDCYMGDSGFHAVCDASSDAALGGCGASSGFGATEKEAAERWNRRASL